MAIFSNLEGTMQKRFVLGKNGAQFTTDIDGNSITVVNYQGTRLLPVEAADPVLNTHLVTLGYFNTHGGSSSTTLRGSTIPAPNLGLDGDVYYQIDETNILQIYIKDQGIWKPLKSIISDTAYVTSYTIHPTDFILKSGSTDVYEYTILESMHNRGNDLLIEVQDPTGNVLDSNVQTDNFGNILISVTGLPSTDVNVQIIGATSMTTPYSELINNSQWVATGNMFTLSISASTHGQVPGSLYLSVYSILVPGSTAAAPFVEVQVDSSIDMDGNIVFTSYESFSGKVVISGR